MFKSRISKVAVAAALALGAASAAHAGFTLSAGNFKFLIDNYDVGNVGYPATPAGVICSTAVGCDAVSSGATGAGTFDTVGIFSVSAITDKNNAIVFVCRASANIGMVLSKSRVVSASIEAAA